MLYVQLCGFCSMMMRVLMMTSRSMSMVRSELVAASFVMPSRFPMMPRSMFMMFRSFIMVFRSFF